MAHPTIRVETWNILKNGKVKRVGKVAVRFPDGTFHGATNFRQVARVGQVATHRRAR